MKQFEAVDVFGNKHIVLEDELKWSAHTYGIVIDAGKVLLVPQFGTRYDLPGGKVDFGETLEQALIREVKEEAGVTVKPLELLGADTSVFVWKPKVATERRSMQSICLYYSCEIVSSKLSAEKFSDSEKQYASQAEWVDLNKIDDIVPAASIDYRKYIKQAMRS